MNQYNPLASRILDAINRVPGCRLEQLAKMLPELTAPQLFGELKRLSQTGEIRLVLDGQGIATVRSSEERSRLRTHKQENPNGTEATRISAADVE
jgi:hypothetical protein